MYVRREGLFQALTTEKALEAGENLQFKGVQLHKKNRIDDPPISPVAFYERLKLSIQKTLISKEDRELSRCGRIQITSQQTQRITFCMGKKKYVHWQQDFS
jgi:hypothetical protein